MTDALGWRRKFGVLAPSTNTIVEPDFYSMKVPGVTSHFSRIYIRDQNLDSNAQMEHLLDQIRSEILYAVDRVMTAQVDYLVMGMSAETFWGGMEGNRKFVSGLEQHSGLKVASGAVACEKALQLFNAKKIGVITPYQEIGDQNVVKFFDDLGIQVVAIKGLRCKTAVDIAHVTEAELREAILDVNKTEVDAVVQAGTNLSMLSLADEAERWIGKPVIAINAATWWYALRDNDIHERLYGFGRLLRDF